MRIVRCPKCHHEFLVLTKRSPGAGSPGPKKLGTMAKLVLVALYGIGSPWI